jgi:dipeptidyl-peptidase-4
LYNLNKKEKSLIYTEEDYEYIPRIKWSNDPNILTMIGLNRHQNKLDFITINAQDASNNILFSEKDKYYIDINDNLTFLPNNFFIWTSEKKGYNHIYLKGLDGSEEQLTKGSWEVTSFDGLDSDKMQIYFRSTEDGSVNRSLYMLDLETGKREKLSTQYGTNSVKFSKGLKYYINTYSNANTPPVYSLHKADGSLVKIIEDNTEFTSKMKDYNLSQKEIFTIYTEKADLNAWIIKPPNFDENKKYPLLMFLYGGPGSQKVLNRYGGSNFYWFQMLAQKGYVVACVDNRGTGGKGSEFKKMTYKELGKYETIDQIDAAKYFGNLKYIDKNRIGIQGWSYGGYMSSLAITKGADIFKLAVAIAPVTNWRYYDNIYTERYMQTPQENSKGYDDNSPINHVEKLKGKYLLIHGTADDNVHVQNTYEMTSALVRANKQFDLFVYPDKNHGIYSRFHLYTKITNFIEENL